MMTEDERLAFLAECEEKFKGCYTDEDPEFKRITGPTGRLPPPVMTNWPAEKPRFQFHQRQQQYQQVCSTFTFLLCKFNIRLNLLNHIN